MKKIIFILICLEKITIRGTSVNEDSDSKNKKFIHGTNGSKLNFKNFNQSSVENYDSNNSPDNAVEDKIDTGTSYTKSHNEIDSTDVFEKQDNDTKNEPNEKKLFNLNDSDIKQIYQKKATTSERYNRSYISKYKIYNGISYKTCHKNYNTLNSTQNPNQENIYKHEVKLIDNKCKTDATLPKAIKIKPKSIDIFKYGFFDITTENDKCIPIFFVGPANHNESTKYIILCPGVEIGLEFELLLDLIKKWWLKYPTYCFLTPINKEFIHSNNLLLSERYIYDIDVCINYIQKRFNHSKINMIGLNQGTDAIMNFMKSKGYTKYGKIVLIEANMSTYKLLNECSKYTILDRIIYNPFKQIACINSNSDKNTNVIHKKDIFLIHGKNNPNIHTKKMK
ncbi:hypothetical protein TCON_2501 [Astathelohania contejeani]|uniref:Alpha/beta hydrolase n=1 Tax=Astathelohania contejeani TaxID=164912 RepID=A0ABQ7HVU0_9MICR|nr:hypothetical protein TCON_2501 [Thelohania contejeani]